MSASTTDPSGPWQAPLSAETEGHLASLLALNGSVPDSALPARLTILPGPKPALPADDAARITTATANRLGLVAVMLTGRAYPVWLRAGTADAKAAQIPPPRLTHRPARILEIGAGAGYRSVALGLAHPDADIIATEPDPAHRRINLLNTLPYGRITTHFLTIGADNARYSTGPTGPDGARILRPDANGALAATPLDAFLRARDGAAPDTVIITPDAACAGLLARPWPPGVRLIVVAQGTGLARGRARFTAPPGFTAAPDGEYLMLHREGDNALPASARFDPLIQPDGQPRRLTMENTAAFHIALPHGFYLPPNPPGAPAACVRLAHDCRAASALHVQLRLPQQGALPVRVTILVTNAAQPANPLCTLTTLLHGGETTSVRGIFPVYSGPCEVSFTAELTQPEPPYGVIRPEIMAAVFS
ncbi:MAG: hypothetical protein POH28_07960 [Acidocella sp.]|nr:hypothetical protein [Acidocella sp.]